jgi:transposase
MRCGFDRLAERVRTVIGQDPLGGHLFVFRSRRGDRLKILLWDREILLWYKGWRRAFAAQRELIPRWSCGQRTGDGSDGIDVSRLKRTPRYERLAKAQKSQWSNSITHCVTYGLAAS